MYASQGRWRSGCHDQTRGPGMWVGAGERFTPITVLDDAGAMLAGVNRWPLLPDEPEPIERLRGVTQPLSEVGQNR